MNEQELEYLKRLEDEGLLSKGLTKKISLMVDGANVIGKRRTRFLSALTCALLACGLMTLGAFSPFHWLDVLAFSTMVIAFLVAFFFFVCGVEEI